MTPEQAPAHLLVVDRDERLRALLRQYLNTQGFLVSIARDAGHARRLLAGLDFDLVLLDAAMPGASDLRGEIGAPALCLTDKTTPAPHGTSSIAKPFEPKALCARINALLDRKPTATPATPKLIRFGELRYDTETAELTRSGALIRLTATEIELFRILAANLGRPLGRGDLVARLGREGLHAKARAVDVQITRLRRKIEDDPKNPRYLQTVRGAGYMLVSDDT